MTNDKSSRADKLPHDAHVRAFRDWHGPLPSEILNARNAARTQDFKLKISAVIRDLKRPMPANEVIDGIDAALNEYHMLKKVRDDEIKAQARQRGVAKQALVQIQKQLNKAATNPFLRREIITAFSPDLHERLQHEIARAADEQLPDEARADALQNAMQCDTEISAIVQRIGRAIDNLEPPKHPGGRPAEPELDRLVARLAITVTWALKKDLTDEEASKFVAPLMKAGGVPRAPFTVEARLSDLNGVRFFAVPLTDAQKASLPIHDL